jgi:CHAT domain-containing protein/tetratricopeptide (TPR) repeat protein
MVRVLGAVAGIAFIGCVLAGPALPQQAATPEAASEKAKAIVAMLKALEAEISRLFLAGKYVEAVPLAEDLLAIREKVLGREHPGIASNLNTLAGLYMALGRYDNAEPLYNRSLAIRVRALGPEHLEITYSLNGLGKVYESQGRYADAEPPYRRSLAILEKVLGPNHPDVAIPLQGLAALYQKTGRYSEAEPLYKRNLTIREKAVGLDHTQVARALYDLSNLYFEQGRYAEARPLLSRSLAVLEKALGADHPQVGATLKSLAQLNKEQGHYAAAEAFAQRALTILERKLGPKHPVVGQTLNTLAEIYSQQGRYAEAEPLYSRNVSIQEEVLGPDNSGVGTALNNLADLYSKQGRYAEAEPLFKRAAAIYKKAMGADHLWLSRSLNNLAWLAFRRKDLAAAAKYWNDATAILQRRAERGLAVDNEEMQRNDWYFVGLVKTTYRVANEGGSSSPASAAAMFETAQWAQSSKAAIAVAQMAVRSASGKSELAAIVRERQDLTGEWQVKDRLLIAAKSLSPDKRNGSVEQALSDRLAAINLRLAEIDVRLVKDFPDYAALSSPKPTAVAAVQASLREGEALVLFLDTGANWAPILPEETFVWVVTKSDVRWIRSELGTEALQREIAALRCGLDDRAWDGEGFKHCSNLLKLPPDKAPKEGAPLPFDAGRAHAVYKSLFGGVEDLIRGRHLLIVPSGALTTLPFQVLVTKAPSSPELASASWLIREHALTVLPSVASLAVLRRTSKPSAAGNPMIGFANPLLDGDQNDPRHGAWYKQQAERARAEHGCAAAPKKRSASLRALGRSPSQVPQPAGLADLSHLRVQTPLPETADEVCDVARSIGADVSEMRIGARANETEIKRLSSSGELAKYRILHFATHGTLAGQLRGTSEPGLILTPPAKATTEDDGYLSGSEIAALKLDADWVILSACNTAGGVGAGEAAEALSGLARVFFYAGARALLVSHWEVDSHAAVKLVTTAIGELAKDRSLGRAEALRRAMLAVMADRRRPDGWVPASHPSVWAPFVVVGEGGASR